MVTIVGLIGCSSEQPSVSPPPAPPAVPQPGVITEVPPATIGVLNATSENHGRVLTQYDGTCAVDVPLASDVIPASGIHLNLHPVDCPPSMKNPAFQHCSQGLLVRISAEHCECEPLAGNPPPAAKRTACPEG